MAEDWTVRRILDWIEGYLNEQGDADPKRSALWLVSDALGLTRLQLYTDLDRPLAEQERVMLRDYTRRRAAGEPLQYITGTTDFRFVTLEVRPGVLIPRPETEVLVSEALSAARQSYPWIDDVALPHPRFNVVDLCTGSGNVAASVAWEIPLAQVLATDISPDACRLAADNVDQLGLAQRVKVVDGDLLEGVPRELLGNVHLVVSNPPYIPSREVDSLDAEVRDFEPRLALDGGVDGLEVFQRLLPPALDALAPDGVLAVELHEETLDEACKLATDAGFADVRMARDLAGRPRVLVGFKR